MKRLKHDLSLNYVVYNSLLDRNAEVESQHQITLISQK